MSTTVKRKAQELVRNGMILEAIGVLKDGISEGETDPYDHVYLGDLHMRVDEKDDCLSCYHKAISSYREVGLVRNAIAIGKKMLRIDAKRPEIHRILAELYDEDGLHGEAIPHYLTYLDSFAGESVPPNEFLETLDRAAAITGSKVEVALRLSDHFIRVNSGDRAAQLLEEVASNASEGGQDDMASELRRRAAELRGGPPPIPDAGVGEEIPIEMELEAPPELPPPPPPLEDSPPIAIDTTAMERALESTPDSSNEASDSAGFVVEHFPASGNDEGEAPPPLAGEDLDFASVDLDNPAVETTDAQEVAESDLTLGELGLGAESGGDTDLESEGPSEDGVFEIDIDDGGLDFGSIGLDEDDSKSSSKTMAMEMPPELADSFASASSDPSAVEDADELGSDETASESIGTGEGFHSVAGAEAFGSDSEDEDVGDAYEVSESDTADSASEEDALETAQPLSSETLPSTSGTSLEDVIAEMTEPAEPASAADLGSTPTPADEVAEEEATPAEILDRANDAFLDGQWSQARNLYDAVLEDEPGNRRVLAKLVETVRYLQDEHAEVHYLSLLGDAWIEEEQLEEAMECFLKVVRLDPENATAKRRLSRFREMGVRGAEVIEESDSNSVAGVLETGRSEIEVRSDNSSEFRSEDWVELEGLLEEFKDGLKKQMDDSDYQAHYDLALSHHGMGLYEEALEAVEFVLASDGVPDESVRQARELKGSCLVGLERHREAVHEYREAAELSGEDPASRRTALYNLGRSLEALEEWQEAAETYVRLRLEAPGFLDVENRIRVCEDQRDSPTEAA